MTNIKDKINEIYKKIYNIMFKEEIEKENIFFVISTFIIYMLIICVSSMFHEAWADEAQAWLIARDLSPWGIIKQMRFEGHSCMWHFMLLPFAKLGLPFDWIKIIPIISAGITGYLVLKKSPFNRLTKLCILFSSTFLYYMPVIVRPYSLLPLMITIISIMNKDKRKYQILYGVVLAVIANIHILMLPFAGMLFLYNYGKDFIYQRKNWSKETKKKILIGSLIAILGMIFIVAQAVAGYFCSIVRNTPVNPNFFESFSVIINDIIRYIMGEEYIKYAYIISLSVIVCILVHSFGVSRWHGAIFFVELIGFFAVMLFIWNSVLNQRAAIIFLLFYYYAWNYRYDINKIILENKKHKLIISNITMVILLVISMLSLKNTYKLILDEIRMAYSPAKEMAKYIDENIEKESVFLSKNSLYVVNVIAYLNDNKHIFYEVLNDRTFTYKIWDNMRWQFSLNVYGQAVMGVKEKDIYIIESVYSNQTLEEIYLYISPGLKQNTKLIYETTETIEGKKMYLWKVNSLVTGNF